MQSVQRLLLAGLVAAQVSAKTLNIVAHQDDDLLFLSPDLLHNVHGNEPLRTIFLTAGDAGNDAAYWTRRQEGSMAAYAMMAGVPNEWTPEDAGYDNVHIPMFTLEGKPDISLVYLQLPDGNMDGSGFESTNHESLSKLWKGDIQTINSVNGKATYTKDSLTSVLTRLIDDFDPLRINTQNFVDNISDNDHSDHYTTAYFAHLAASQATNEAEFAGYLGYDVTARGANVQGENLQTKQNVFFYYAGFDPGTCPNLPACAGRPEPSWLERMYII
ncbi:uncharacterized protein ATNIH1004_005663 [Aspergillus tanneri]|uniref:N-acetylglucosaminylphosphatidylinositol deacetylase n=1 Tax=Aspergillus tanneri TaxID=1220188 RepID=A0A5M9MNG1_9EURO|nr:uncharacterized protein ATNIH1004_005663 [Aspergillus tanneri]KAA8646984.1 hypothetical protein ATNIH1004_005663 [Aspergillus tanneri]